MISRRPSALFVAVLIATLLAVAACTEPVAPPLVVDSDDFRAARRVAAITATNLGVLPGDNQSLAWGVNRLGQAVGQSTGANRTRAFLWQSGAMTDITPSDYDGAAYAINNASPTAQATGSLTGSFDVPGSSQTRAIRWTLTATPTFQELDLAPSYGRGINDHGTVVGGVCCDPGGDWVVAIWTAPFVRETIAPLTGYTYSTASDINNAGDVVGESHSYSGPGSPEYRAWIRRAGGSMVALPPLPGEASSRALALSEPNVNGEIFVAGLSETATSQSAVRWTVSSEGVIIQYVGTSGWADGAHNDGHVAGTTLGRKQYAFLWRNGQIEKLPPVKGGSSSAVRGMDRGGAPGDAILVAGETRVSNWPRATIWTIAD
jgi:probable HAF family extracellular repeat protein